jgi:hypothetical protein
MQGPALEIVRVFGTVPGDVETILTNPHQAAERFLEREPIRSLHFLFFHLPFLLLLPVFVLISPYRLFSGSSFSTTAAFFPVFLILGFLFLSAVFDRMQRFSTAGGLDPDRKDYFSMDPPGKNLALFMHLPLSASTFLFFLHPLPGYLALFLTAVYCIYQSIVEWARIRNQTILESLATYVVTIGLGLLPVLILVLLYNILKTFGILGNLYL